MKQIIILISLVFAHLTTQVEAAEKPLSVGILLYPGVQIIDFTGPYEVFGWANYKVSTVSQDGKPIITTMNLKVTPSYSFADSPRFDIVVIPGGEIDNANNKATLDWVKTYSQSATRVLSVCNGTFILAEAGLLNGLSATTFYPALETLKDTYPKIKTLANKRFVDNGKFVTSAGLSSGIDAALHLVAQDLGIEKAKSIAANIEYGWSPENGYIRGNMADSQLATIRKNISGLINSDPIYAYGSESEWLESYSTSSKNIEAIKIGVLSAIAKTPEWLPSDNAWFKKSNKNSQWVLEISYPQKEQELPALKIHLYQKYDEHPVKSLQ